MPDTLSLIEIVEFSLLLTSKNLSTKTQFFNEDHSAFTGKNAVYLKSLHAMYAHKYHLHAQRTVTHSLTHENFTLRQTLNGVGAKALVGEQRKRTLLEFCNAYSNRKHIPSDTAPLIIRITIT